MMKATNAAHNVFNITKSSLPFIICTALVKLEDYSALHLYRSNNQTMNVARPQDIAAAPRVVTPPSTGKTKSVQFNPIIPTKNLTNDLQDNHLSTISALAATTIRSSPPGCYPSVHNGTAVNPKKRSYSNFTNTNTRAKRSKKIKQSQAILDAAAHSRSQGQPPDAPSHQFHATTLLTIALEMEKGKPIVKSDEEIASQNRHEYTPRDMYQLRRGDLNVFPESIARIHSSLAAALDHKSDYADGASSKMRISDDNDIVGKEANARSAYWSKKSEDKTIPFLRRLVEMLRENEDVISFVPGNRRAAKKQVGQIIIHNRVKVEGDILPKYFNHASFASLRRQLNYFHFVRVGKGRQIGATYRNDAVYTMDDILRLKRRSLEEHELEARQSVEATPKSQRRFIRSPEIKAAFDRLKKEEGREGSTGWDVAERGTGLWEVVDKPPSIAYQPVSPME